MTARVYLRTFGCRANQYDSETVRAMVEGAGGSIVDRVEDATVAVFNSCVVTAAAEADLRRSVRHAARANAALETVIMGCAAARDTGVLADLPTVRHVIPGADLPAIAEALGIAARSGALPVTQTGTRALLRVQDGCDEHCTFCATTLARGANRSRPLAELVGEAQALAERHPEIVLTGIHIGSYGRDIDSSLGADCALSLVIPRGDGGRRPSVRSLRGCASSRAAPSRTAPIRIGSDAQAHGPTLVHSRVVCASGAAPCRE